MKKMLFFASYVLAVCMICSCTNENVPTGTEAFIKPTYKTLTELEAYNELMLGKKLTRTSDENSGAVITTDDATDAINVVSADVSGAAAGIIAGKEIAAVAGATTAGTGALITEAIFASVFGAAASYKVYKDNHAELGNQNAQVEEPDPAKKGVSMDAPHLLWIQLSY